MKISPQWLRDWVDLRVDDARLAADLSSVGAGVEGISGEGENTVFEMEITTNRPDEMNHYGIAREAAAIYDLPLRPIEPKLPPAAKAASQGAHTGTTKVVPSQLVPSRPVPSRGNSDSVSGAGGSTAVASAVAASPATAPFPIEIYEPDLCPRFTARVIRNVRIAPSPKHVQHRLGLLDQRPINNAVDATNYVLWEIGKPTHVFDMDLLDGKIVVRRARNGEKLKTLDGVERTLSSEDVVVADAVKAVGLAGVMGGYDTMITDKTRNILIESAWWDPISIRKTSRRHGIHTDASHRFERGADFNSTILSTDRVAELILQSGDGDPVGDVIDVIAKQIDQAPILLRISEVRRVLGDQPQAAEIVRILRKLGFDITPEKTDESEFTVEVPSWRLDVEREIDLIEEIARLYGYDRFPKTLPTFSGAVIEQPDADKDAKLRSSLLGLGYDEAISLVFISKEDAARFSSAQQVELANPLSAEASVMRTSLIPGMLDMIAYNLNRSVDNVRLFEAGSVYEYVGPKSVETKRISLGATGSAVVPGVHQPPRPYSFYDMKGDVETLLDSFQHNVLYYDPHTSEYFHPGRSVRAVIDGTTMAQFGQIHPDIASARKLRQDVYVAELYLDHLYQHGLRELRYEALPRYPAVQRDFSLIFPDSVLFEIIQTTALSLDIKELRSFEPVEIFRGGAVPAGKYSLLLRAAFQSSERTLREDEVAQWSAAIIKALEGLGGSLRSS